LGVRKRLGHQVDDELCRLEGHQVSSEVR
jgi:hypothetical protein